MLIMEEGKYVSRDEIARIDTPSSTASWKPVPHIDVIEAVAEVVNAHKWDIEDERFGLASEGQKMFGVMEISRSSSPQWHRCIGIRNSHDKSLCRVVCRDRRPRLLKSRFRRDHRHQTQAYQPV